MAATVPARHGKMLELATAKDAVSRLDVIRSKKSYDHRETSANILRLDALEKVRGVPSNGSSCIAPMEFEASVEEGLKLAKRVYAGKEQHTAVLPRQPPGMERGRASLLPTAPMVYAVIVDPAIVDNPDFPSYQPHVYGRCDPPALIPLQMKEIAMEVDCYLDTAFATVRGNWRVHCVMGSRKCDCRLVVPMGEKGSILGAEVKFARRSYSTQVVQREDQNLEKFLKHEQWGILKPFLFSLAIPQVDGGCDIYVEVRWCQKLLYGDGHFSNRIPFIFPEYVTPFAKIVAKHEKIRLNVDIGTEKEVIIQGSSHALKEKFRQAGKFAFLYEADVENWSSKDFEFSYSVFSNDVYGGILLKSPLVHDPDQRNMFCLYLYPSNNSTRKVFRKEVVFLVDISGSMQGKPLEGVKSALYTVLSELSPADCFNIIAFNEEIKSFSSSIKPANEDTLENARQWISKNFVAYGGTNIMQPLNEALQMFDKNSYQSTSLLPNTKDSIPYIFLVTDGTVEDERDICLVAKSHFRNAGSMPPRICTFGIGSYCNHYFLQLLALIGRGQYGAAFDQDSVESEMQKWFTRALFPVVTNIKMETFDDIESFEVCPCNIPDLLVGCPLIISGRYKGKFPRTVKAEGMLADMNDTFINLVVQNSGDVPIEKVFAKQEIDLLTAQAWLSESKQLEEKVARLSIQYGIPSEYTDMIFRVASVPQEGVKQKRDKRKHGEAENEVATLVHHLRLGFGNLTATVENLPPACRQPIHQPETFAVLEKAASCCNDIGYCCCCMCCIQVCSRLSDRFVIALTQLVSALGCFACSECCVQLCCNAD